MNSRDNRAAVPIIAAVTIALMLIVAIASTAVFMGVAMMDVDHAGMMGWRRDDADEQAPLVSSAREVTVEIRDFAFYPDNLTVDAGTRVTWVNRDSVVHTATADSDAWDSGSLGQDDEYSFVFDSPGSYSYYCRPHPYMVATVTVR